MNRRSIAFLVLAALVTASCGGGGSRNIPTGPGTDPPPNTGGNNPPPVEQPVPTLAVTKIMAFGDSLTEGESLGQLLVPTADPSTPGVPTSYPAKLSATLTGIYKNQTIRVFNAGRGGEFAIGSAKDRLIAMLNTYQPEVLLLFHGVNNVNAVDPIITIVEAVEEMVEIAHARGIHVMLGNLPPQIPTPKATGGARISQYNAWMPLVASEEGATFVDLFSNINASTMLMPDGLHLNEAGNVKIAELFYAALKAKYHREPQ